MKTNRLSETITEALNEQLTKEAHAAQIFLSYGAWADNEGYGGIANFLFRHSAEERNHMMKVLEYILKRGARAIVAAIPPPAADPTSINNLFEKVLEHECDNTSAINKIVKMAFNEEDWITYNFMQWFVNEQAEEETLALELLDKIKIAGGETASPEVLYELNKDLEKAPDDAKLAQDVTTDEP